MKKIILFGVVYLALVLSANGQTVFKDIPQATTTYSPGGGGSAVESVATNVSEFDAAITAAGATSLKISLLINGTVTINSLKTIPANLYFQQVNNGLIVKSGSGQITCQGKCLENPTSAKPLFSGFTPGDIIWSSATDYPQEISAGIFANANASTRINMADRAFLNKPVTILATLGTLVETATINEKHWLKLPAGRFVNNTSCTAPIELASYTRVTGVGPNTILPESTVVCGNYGYAVIIASNVALQASANAADHINKSIIVEDLQVVGDPSRPTTQNAASIHLGNAHDSYIQRIKAYRVNGYAFFYGINSTFGGGGARDDGAFSHNSYIIDNIIEDSATQAVGSINSDGLFIQRNTFINTGFFNDSGQYSNFIDLEPNTAGARMDNWIISDNIFNSLAGRANPSTTAIIVQGGSGVKNGIIDNNSIIGANIPLGFPAAYGQAIYKGLSAGIVVASGINVSVTNNRITGTSQTCINVTFSSSMTIQGNTCQAISDIAILLVGVHDSVIRDNNLPRRLDAPIAVNSGFSDVFGNDSHKITERDGDYDVTVFSGGTGGRSYLQSNAALCPYMVKRIIYLSPVTNVPGGYYEAAESNDQCTQMYLTTAAGGTASGVETIMTTKYSKNHYINNYGAEYYIPTDSLSTITDNTLSEQIKFANFFASGLLQFTDEVNGEWILGRLNPSGKEYISLISIQATSRTANQPGASCTTLPKVRVRNSLIGPDSVAQDMTITTNNSQVLTNFFFDYPSGFSTPLIYNPAGNPIVVSLVNSAVCSNSADIPQDYNISVGFKTGGGPITRTAKTTP